MPTEDAYSSGHLVLSHFGACKCSNVETNISWACLVSGLLSFEHPSVLLFLLLQIFEKVKSVAYLVHFRYWFIARTTLHPFYCKWFLTMDNWVRRLLLLKMLLYFLMADAIDDLRPNWAYTGPFWVLSGCVISIKRLSVVLGGITFSRKRKPGHASVLHVKVSLLQR